MLEKAWAKNFGAYQNIAGGLMSEALRDLTGACVKSYFTRIKEYKLDYTEEFLWTEIAQAEKNNWIMTAGTDDIQNGSDAYIEKIGICGSHAYSLLSAVEIYENQGKYSRDPNRGRKIRLILMRNPWGQNEWKGEWSDFDVKWKDPALRKLLDHETTDDGCFYMLWKDFLKYYSDFQICYYYDDFKYSALRINSEENEIVYVQFTI